MNSVLYIPGLGDDRSLGRQRIWTQTLNVFRRRSKAIHFFDPKWETGEAYTDKFLRLTDFYQDNGSPQAVCGVSAGASLAVRLTAENPSVEQLHLVCGKIFGSEKIGQHYIDRAPAFVDSVTEGEKLALQINTTQTHCYIPKNDADGVIESIDMRIVGAHEIVLPALKHAYAIGYTLVRYLPGL